VTEEIIFQTIASELNLTITQIKNTMELLDEGNTVPFISRYRKEKTGNLNEEQIREIQDRVRYLRNLEHRRETILRSIAEQGKLTPRLSRQIKETFKLQELEDLYLPFRPKKQTRASIAREKGLSPLAQLILVQEIVEGEPEEIAREYINPDKKIYTAEEALSGAMDIIAEIISENSDIRKFVRTLLADEGNLTSRVRKEDGDKAYEMYFDFSEAVKLIPPHRVLAINRGEKEGELLIDIEVEEEIIYDRINQVYISNDKSVFLSHLKRVIQDAYKRLITPSIKREVRAELTRQAESHAIKVFALNLRSLLLQPPVPEKIIMGIDPGFRTGCKVAVIDAQGNYREGATIYPHPPQHEYFAAKSILRELIEKYQVSVVAIGNGTASRETELMVAEVIHEIKPESEVSYIIVSEAGASVYSASTLAQEEFPDLEASLRGNISIARRLQDPLAELVKIDPRSIGVGLYQHDVNQKEMAHTLTTVVESCVNRVGVDLNTASAALLKYVSGLNSKMARNIVEYREQNGRFRNRNQLKQIPGIGEKVFQQAAGFLRIRGGTNPLDATSIHPESYPVAEKLISKFAIDGSFQGGVKLKERLIQENMDLNNLALELECGLPTLEDILNNIEKPGRDPREDLPKPIFRSDVLKMEDLRVGMGLKGTVRNVVDFGVFVDIGVKQDGLLHVSQMGKKYVKNPYELMHVGDEINVKILSIDLERKRISLTIKDEK
jgi:uncharacterized protein